MPVDHVVREGECIAVIAARYGFFPDTIWQDGANSGLRSKRATGYMLVPGDVVHVRDLEEKWEGGATESTHRFRRKGIPEYLRVRVLDAGGRPVADAAYELTIDGRFRDGKTDGDGRVEEPLPPGARRAVLEIREKGIRREIRLSALEPIETVRGMKARLTNLGFVCGEVDGKRDDAFRDAALGFRVSRGMAAPEGDDPVDDAFRGELKKAHGS